MIATKTVMNEEQKVFMAELAAIIEPLRAAVAVIDAEEQEAMKVVHEIRKRKKTAMNKVIPYGMIQPAVVSTRSRMKYFPEFYGRTAEELDDSLIAQAGIMKDKPEDITRFIAEAKEIISTL